MGPSPTAYSIRDLSQTEAWLRDALIKILVWSGTVIVLLAGWTLGAEDVFSLATCQYPFTDHNCQRAVALAVGYPILLVGWIYLVLKVRERCPEHATVPSKRMVRIYVAGMTIFSVLVLCFLLD